MRPKCTSRAGLAGQPNGAWMLRAVSVCVGVCWCVLVCVGVLCVGVCDGGREIVKGLGLFGFVEIGKVDG